MTYYRIQAKATDTATLLDSNNWISLNWNEATMSCRGCTDCEPIQINRGEYTGLTCGGSGEIDQARYGVSACRDLDDLADYAAHTGMDLWSTDMAIVEINGPTSPDTAEDAHLGEVLILPDTIASVVDLGDEFIEDVFARREAIGIDQ